MSSRPPPVADTSAAPLELQVKRPGVSLFWRTFFFLSLLLLGSILAWLQTFRSLEFEPRALQSAQQLASLVNLTRASLENADAIGRLSLVKTLVDQENVRIAPREPSDTYALYNTDSLSQRISDELSRRMGVDTIVAREVNGFPGLWVGFTIDGDTYWLLTDPARIGAVAGTTWLVWLAIAVLLSLAGAALIARLINRPLKNLSFAASRVREGDFDASHLDEGVATSEIREVNIGFNRMAQKLSMVEQERALMLAGISHDLRTPLARLRLETEMSVADEQARSHMAADIEQVNAIIDKFLDYARSDHLKLARVRLDDIVRAAVFAMEHDERLSVSVDVAEGTMVLGDAVELQRVFANLLENAVRYGRSAPSGKAEVEIASKAKDKWVLVKVRDHGPGVSADQLERLTQPFYRGDTARTSASGAGLGLAIVERTVSRMGGEFALANTGTGGLAAHIKLQRA